MDIDTIKEALRDNYPDLAPKTISNYATNFVRLYDELGNRKIRLIKSVLKSDFMKSKADSTRGLYIYSAISVLKALNMISESQLDDYYSVYEKLQNKIKRDREKKVVDLPDVDPKKIISDLDKKIKKEKDTIRKERLIQDKLIALVYTRLPPRRSEDYYKMMLTDVPLKKEEELSKAYN